MSFGTVIIEVKNVGFGPSFEKDSYFDITIDGTDTGHHIKPADIRTIVEEKLRELSGHEH